jgi:hypothetical protein
MTTPRPIGAMSFNRVFLGGLLSSRARLRFPGHPHAATPTPARRDNLSERHTGTSQTVSLQGVTPERGARRLLSVQSSGASDIGPSVALVPPNPPGGRLASIS